MGWNGDGKRGESQHIREDATSRQAGSHEGCRKNMRRLV